ncbi:Uu.00g089290.m01.CDS01 [Anthostomella pinea]|uniref:Uu.00g089290.m01.CDS01 n=1 Tax=Anthostomella pinea TaxID=933095 RepID=A0AAI8YKA7_9PEZI|nr:Uu.00g089290.m01.CDS01 [Anthostomella pinea]
MSGSPRQEKYIAIDIMEQRQREELNNRITHLRLLEDFITTDLAYYLDLQTQIVNKTIETISFEDLWYLFRPGDVVYARNQGHEQLYKVHSLTGGQLRRRNHTRDEMKDRRNVTRPVPLDGVVYTAVEESGSGTWSPFMIDCFTMGFDGVLVGPIDTHRQIKHYSRRCKITDLPIYPLRFHKQEWEVTAKLEARGRAFISCYGHKSYSGITITRTKQGPQEEHFQGDIYIDLREYYLRYSLERPHFGTLQKAAPDVTEVDEGKDGRRFFDHEVDEKITKNFICSHYSTMEPTLSNRGAAVQDSPEVVQILGHQVPAYLFRHRKYVHVYVENVKDIDDAEDTGWEDLVIPDGHRNLLVSLVENHTKGGVTDLYTDNASEDASQIDIVRGKGRGLVILLHGPPGSGKTSTAETVAAYTRRPLYAVTCGDLGLSPREIEHSLREHTDRAHRWGCVLLLDEADVFLTRRDWRDMSRNALVSVFLRQLEYYAGILFLTTNRVGVIDEAFKSRIHVSLRYPRLRLQETQQLWEKTLARIERDNKRTKVQIKFDRGALLAFAKKHYNQHEETETTWNGRQIRNAFQTAIALGQYDRQKALREAKMTSEDAEKTGQKKGMMMRLTTANFRDIAKAAREFEDHLTNVRGLDHYLARENQWRDDMHDPEAPEVKKDYGRSLAPRSSHGRPSDYLSPQSSTMNRPRKMTASSSSSKKQVAEESDQDEEDIFEEDLSDD